MDDGPYGPYLEPEGSAIEKAMLKFLLANEVDIHGELVKRNRH